MNGRDVDVFLCFIFKENISICVIRNWNFFKIARDPMTTMRLRNTPLVSLACKTLRMKSFFLSGGVREKRVECERSCVTLVRLFTWRIRRGGSRQEVEGWEVNKPAKARLLLWRARSSSIVCRRTRFSKCPWRMSARQTIPWEKALSGEEGDRYHDPDSVGSSRFFFFSPSPPFSVSSVERCA